MEANLLNVLINGGAVGLCIISFGLLYIFQKNGKEERKDYLVIIKNCSDKMDEFRKTITAFSEQNEKQTESLKNLADVLNTNAGIIKEYVDAIRKKQF